MNTVYLHSYLPFKFLFSVKVSFTVFPVNTALCLHHPPLQGSPGPPCWPQCSDVHQPSVELQFGWKPTGTLSSGRRLRHRRRRWADCRRPADTCYRLEKTGCCCRPSLSRRAGWDSKRTHCRQRLRAGDRPWSSGTASCRTERLIVSHGETETM